MVKCKTSKLRQHHVFPLKIQILSYLYDSAKQVKKFYDECIISRYSQNEFMNTYI